jgi:hypothetical protein
MNVWGLLRPPMEQMAADYYTQQRTERLRDK